MIAMENFQSDLSGRTGTQVTLKILHSYHRLSIEKNLKFQLTYFPGLYSSAV